MMGLHVYKELPIPSRPGTKVRYYRLYVVLRTSSIQFVTRKIEGEHPDCVLAMFPSGSSELRVDYGELSAAIAEFPKLEWKGKPNILSKEHVCWDVIYRTAEAMEKPLVNIDKFSIDPSVNSGSLSEKSYKGFTVREVARKRSAVDMDGVTTMDRDICYQILLHCLSSGSVSEGKQMKPMTLPLRALSGDVQVHSALFVQSDGVATGIVLLGEKRGSF